MNNQKRMLHMGDFETTETKKLSLPEKLNYIEISICRLSTKIKPKVRSNFHRIKILYEKGMNTSANRLIEVTYASVKRELNQYK